MYKNNGMLEKKKKYLLLCQPGAKFIEKICSSIGALIGAFGSAAIIAPSSILSTLVPIKREEEGDTLYK